MKKISVFLISVLLALLMSGCKAQPPAEGAASSSASSTPSQAAVYASSVSSVSSVSSRSAPVSSSEQSSLTVTISIDGTKGGYGMILSDTKLKISAGDTVYSALMSAAGKYDIAVGKTTLPSVYISSIGGLGQFDKGSQSGWVYRVGGELPDKSCGDYKLSGGEKIEWIYTLDNGAAEGGIK
jgi:hypothetical protein